MRYIIEKYFENNPDRLVINNIGSRNSTIYIYWLCDLTQVICGCFKGSLLQFEKAVIQTHRENEHGKRYIKLINKVYEMMEKSYRMSEIRIKM